MAARREGTVTGVTWYSVLVAARAPGQAHSLAGDGDQFATLLESCSGAVSYDETSWEARVSVQAAGPAEAAALASGAVAEAARAAGLPGWPVVHAAATAEDWLDDFDPPAWPDLVSGPEAAEILGVSGQRLHQLAAEHAGFPKPAYELRAGRLWVRAAVERFGERWERRPGRPRKDTTAARGAA